MRSTRIGASVPKRSDWPLRTFFTNRISPFSLPMSSVPTHGANTCRKKAGVRWMREDEEFKDYSIEREGPGRRPALGRHLLPPNRSSVSREKGMVCKRAENFPFTGGTVRNSGKNRNVKYGCGNVKRMRWCDTVLFGTMKALKSEEESL